MSLLGHGALSEQQKRNKDSMWFCFKHFWTSLAWSILCVRARMCAGALPWACTYDGKTLTSCVFLYCPPPQSEPRDALLNRLVDQQAQEICLSLSPRHRVQISTAVLTFMWELGNWTRVNLFTQQSLLPSAPSISSVWVKYFEDLLVSKLFLKFDCIAAYLFNLLISSSV